MEIRDPIHGQIDISSAEENLLDSVAYQRLRSIKQLGFSEFSFPGATHNRYLHSIGVSHVAAQAFDSIFSDFEFSSGERREELRQCLKLAALLHDIGHGPLSHTTEDVMPKMGALEIGVYNNRRTDIQFDQRLNDPNRQADHEDYTIKFITDSSLTENLKRNFPHISPLHIACLIDKTLACPDDFFKDQSLDFRTVLSQIVSSEMDADRLDYLERDAYYCGVNYGHVELSWLIANLSFLSIEGNLHLALNRRAIYAFDDFLLARHHMHLMAYFHHKAIIYEEMLHRYLLSKDCEFYLPANIEDYIKCTDDLLYQHLRKVDNEWAQRISGREPFKMVFELHETTENMRPSEMQNVLEEQGIRTVLANSSHRLSRYHSGTPVEKSFPIYVVDQYDPVAKPYRIEQTTEIFKKYEDIRRIERLYVEPEKFDQAQTIIVNKKL